MRLQNKLRNINKHVQIAEEFVIDQLSRLATYLAPLVPAFLVYHASKLHIDGVTEVQAWIIAGVIELLGLSVVSNWLNVKEYNRIFPDDRLSTWGHIAMVLFYVATILAIVFGLKVDPVAFSWVALLSLSVLSLISAIAFVMRRQHSARLAEYEEDIERLEREREHKRQIRQREEDIRQAMELEQARAEHEQRLQEIRNRAERQRRLDELEAERIQREQQLAFEARRAELGQRTMTGQVTGQNPTTDNTPPKSDRLSYIVQQPDTTPQELADMWGYSERQARRDLAEAGFQRNGDGRYHRHSSGQ